VVHVLGYSVSHDHHSVHLVHSQWSLASGQVRRWYVVTESNRNSDLLGNSSHNDVLLDLMVCSFMHDDDGVT